MFIYEYKLVKEQGRSLGEQDKLVADYGQATN